MLNVNVTVVKNKDVVNIMQKNSPFAAADFRKANEKYTIGRIAFIGGGAFVVTGLLLLTGQNYNATIVMSCLGAAAIGFSIPFLTMGEKERKRSLHYYNKHIATTDVNRLQLKLSMSNISINYNF